MQEEKIGRALLRQTDAELKIGHDAVLLAAFAGRGARACDLGCGCGTLMLLLCEKWPKMRIDGVEIRLQAAELARESVIKSGLSDRARVFTADFTKTVAGLNYGAYDLAVSNPPYYKVDAGKSPSAEGIALAKTEISCDMDAVCAAARRLLKNGGRFCVCYPPERLSELFCTLKEYALEPKRMRAVHARADKDAGLILTEARAGGNPGLLVEPPLILA